MGSVGRGGAGVGPDSLLGMVFEKGFQRWGFLGREMRGFSSGSDIRRTHRA